MRSCVLCTFLDNGGPNVDAEALSDVGVEVPTDDDRVICIENSDDSVLVDDADASKLCQIYTSPWCRWSQISSVCHHVGNSGARRGLICMSRYAKFGHLVQNLERGGAQSA
jgi:hypothetical protein